MQDKWSKGHVAFVTERSNAFSVNLWHRLAETPGAISSNFLCGTHCRPSLMFRLIRHSRSVLSCWGVITKIILQLLSKILYYSIFEPMDHLHIYTPALTMWPSFVKNHVTRIFWHTNTRTDWHRVTRLRYIIGLFGKLTTAQCSSHMLWIKPERSTVISPILWGWAEANECR